jgi:hypothetical protein
VNAAVHAGRVSTPEITEAAHEGARAFRRTFLQAAATVSAEADADVAYRSATVLREEADRIVGDAAALRARMALRVWEERGPMSLSQLAATLGTSKARADQFLRAARAAAETALTEQE